MIGYVAELRMEWIVRASDLELVRTYYDYCGSDDLESVAVCDACRGEIVRRFMLSTLEKEHERKKVEGDV